MEKTLKVFFRDNSLVFSDLLECDLVVAGDINARTQDDLNFIPDIHANVQHPTSQNVGA